MSIQNRLHRKYGPGLGDLRKSISKQAARRHRLMQSNDPLDGGDSIEETAGGAIDISKPESCIIGLAVGNQLNDDTFGGCAYVAVDYAEFLGTMGEDWKRVLTEGSWYTFFVYDLVKIGKNTIASYE